MANYLYDKYNYAVVTTYTWNKYTAKDVTYYKEDDFYEEEVIDSNPASDFSYTGSESVRFRDDVGYYSLSAPHKTITKPPSDYALSRSDYVYKGVGYPVVDPTYGNVYRQYEKYSFVRNDKNSFVFCRQERRKARGPFESTRRGEFVESVAGQSYSYKGNGLNDDGFWWVRGDSKTTNVQGAYVDTIEAELGTYPTNGISGGYWYVLRKRAFPELKIRKNNQLYTSADGWVRVSGQLRQIQQIWVRVNGSLKEV